METTKSKEDLIQELAQFVCTVNYYQHNIGNLKLLLTDGCNYIRQELNAFWLFDLILSYQLNTKVKCEPFQVWKLINKGKHWQIICTDGNDILLAKQIIEFSDFPLDEITIWIEDDIALLPSEH